MALERLTGVPNPLIIKDRDGVFFRIYIFDEQDRTYPCVYSTIPIHHSWFRFLSTRRFRCIAFRKSAAMETAIFALVYFSLFCMFIYHVYL